MPITTSVVNGTTVYTDDLGSCGVMWYIEDEQLRLDMGDHYVWFSISDGSPVHIEIPQVDPGNDPGEEHGEEPATTYRILTDFPALSDPSALLDTLLANGIAFSYAEDGVTYVYAAKGCVFSENEDAPFYADFTEMDSYGV